MALHWPTSNIGKVGAFHSWTRIWCNGKRARLTFSSRILVYENIGLILVCKKSTVRFLTHHKTFCDTRQELCASWGVGEIRTSIMSCHVYVTLTFNYINEYQYYAKLWCEPIEWHFDYTINLIRSLNLHTRDYHSFVRYIQADNVEPAATHKFWTWIDWQRLF